MALAARVAWKTAFTMSLMSTFTVDAKVGADGVWGAETEDDGAEKAGLEETTGDTWSHDWRGECSHELGWDVISMWIERLRGSWIQRILSCLLRFPLISASLST